MITTYRPSGKFSPTVFGLALGAAVALAAVGFVYQKLISWISFIYVNAALMAGLAFVGWAVMKLAMKMGKCRNVALASLLGVGVGLAAAGSTHYFAYQNMLDEIVPLVKQEHPELTEPVIRQSFSFGDFIETRVETGWSVGKARSGSSGGGLPISGVFVYIIWLIEAGVIAGGAYMGGKAAVGTPYCEGGDRWADVDEQIVTLAGQTPQSATMLAAAESVDDLLLLPTATTDAPNSMAVVYELHKAANYEDEAFLTVAAEITAMNKEGKVEKTRTPIWPAIDVTPDQVDRLRESANMIAPDGRLKPEFAAADESGEGQPAAEDPAAALDALAAEGEADGAAGGNRR